MLQPDSKKMPPLRRSQRSSAMSDEHTLKKVERGVAARNLETTGTSASSLSFTDSRISSNLSNIGVSLARDDKLINNYIVSIKNRNRQISFLP